MSAVRKASWKQSLMVMILPSCLNHLPVAFDRIRQAALSGKIFQTGDVQRSLAKRESVLTSVSWVGWVLFVSKWHP